MDNESLTAASGQITQSIIVDLTSSVSLIDPSFSAFGQNITVATTSPTLNLASDDGDGPGYQASGPDSALVNFGNAQVTGNSNVNSAVWNQYTGSGTFTINTDGIQTNDFGSLGGVAFSGTPASTFGSVTVTYTTVPEPSSVMLLGLAGLGTLVRRRRN